MKKIKIGLKSYECDKYSEDEMINSLQSLKQERDEALDAAEKAKAYKRVLKETNAQLKRERDSWKAAYDNQVELVEKTKKLLDNADKHSKMYP